MSRLEIRNFGPIHECDIELTRYNLITGEQASGKSTIMKIIFLCRKVRYMLKDLLIKKHTMKTSWDDSGIEQQLQREIRSAFLNIYGPTKPMDNDLYVKYNYSEKTFLKLSLRDRDSFLECVFNKELYEAIRSLNDLKNLELENLDLIDCILDELFGTDDREVIYIPAGRSMMSVLVDQLSYLSLTMTEDEKRRLDYATLDFIKNVVKAKSSFSGEDEFYDSEYIRRRNSLMKGKYIYTGKEDLFYFSDNKYSRVNHISSGQQDILWVLNFLCLNTFLDKKTCFLIEEPESRLYPATQKEVISFIIEMIGKGNHEITFTTHSPYVVSVLNTLLFASQLNERDIIPSARYFDFSEFNVYWTRKNGVQSSLLQDDDIVEINQDVIDFISNKINDEFDSLLEVYHARKF